MQTPTVLLLTDRFQSNANTLLIDLKYWYLSLEIAVRSSNDQPKFLETKFTQLLTFK